MIEVREVLRRWCAGQSARQINRDGVADRKTVARYIEAAEACGVLTEESLSDEVVAEVARRVQSRKSQKPSLLWRRIDTHRARIETWLNGDEALFLVRVHELLERDGVKVGYTTLRRYVRQELGWRSRSRLLNRRS